jgi:hypothetical protein
MNLDSGYEVYAQIIIHSLTFHSKIPVIHKVKFGYLTRKQTTDQQQQSKV